MALFDVLRSESAEFSQIEDLFLITKSLGNPAYDFNFSLHFDSVHPFEVSPGTALLRIGAPSSYEQIYAGLQKDGIALINTPEQYKNVTDLRSWYPLIQQYTPRSRWFESIPKVADVADDFGWPLFVKGERQTNRHSERSVVKSPKDFVKLMEDWKQDRVLSWQNVVVREFVDLRPVGGDTGGKVPPKFEFRTFWLDETLLDSGPYWSEFSQYDWNETEKREALRTAREVIKTIDARFVVIDLAQTEDGEWIVIELNSGQESGYAGTFPPRLWRNFLDVLQRC